MINGKWLVVVGIVTAGVIFWQQWPDNNLRVIACDVGQGDAILVTKGFNQILVDGGPDGGKVMDCLGRRLPFWDRRLELAVATHPDADHIGGLPEVIERYQVAHVLMSDAGKNTQGFWRLYQAVRESGANLTIADQGMQLNLDGISMKVLSPAKDGQRLQQWYQNMSFIDQTAWSDNEAGGGEVNERSVVLEFNFGQVRGLLTGDAPVETENQLDEIGLLTKANILKVGHHGSSTSTGDRLLAVVKPELCLISVGSKNRYGHPSEVVVQKLQAAGCQVKRTDEQGSIVVTTDGMKIW